ncbi:MAG: DegT/DnrJ/EryC1/StrS family aminotransferase, partial [Chthoniobacterales bacterium]
MKISQPHPMPPPSTSALAVNGGTPEISNSPSVNPHPRWGEEEKELLIKMLEQPSLFYWKGPQTQLLTERFQKHYPFDYVMPCSSGTAAIHIAVTALNLKPGDEIIVPPITDMGTVIGALYEQAVPVFADLGAHTYNLDPADVRKKITPKTRAIIAVHLTGNPCPITKLRAIADEHNITLIEDCAQAWGAKYDGKPVGSFGDIACYSLNDFKHIGCGDGGIVATSDAKLGEILQKCGDKAYDRVKGTKTPAFLAPNYRISEPQSAVAAAQMDRMVGITERRNELGMSLSAQLAELPAMDIPEIDEKAFSSFWFYLLRIREEELTCDREEFVKALQAEGVIAVAGYTPMPLYQYDVFKNHNFFGGQWP